jgi:hypothetical protein
MLYLALAAALFLGWVWMRSEIVRGGGWRVGAGLLATVLIVVGAVLSIKGDWWIGLPMVLTGLGSATGGRIYRGATQPGGGARKESPSGAGPAGMSPTEARSILGVGPGATPEEIKAAYVRLMKRNHPDQGGTAGLASKLNAARETLLEG